MKKIISAAVLSLCVFGTTSSAFAYFDAGTLTQVVYDEKGPLNYGTLEIGTDLVNVLTTDFSTMSNYQAAAAGNINKGALNWSDLRLAYYADNYNGASSTFFFATTSPTATGYSYAQIIPFHSEASDIRILYAAASNRTINTTPAELKSYDRNMNANSKGPGLYAGLNSPNPGAGEADLSDLNTKDHVDMYLYEVAYNGGWTMVNGNGTDYVAKLTLNSDGSTIINAAAVPVPASVLLFGSGLLGMLGIRRKES